MSRAEFDDVQARMLSPEARLDVDQTPPERPSEVCQWSLAARAARLENLFRMLACELSYIADRDAALPGFGSGA